jgi:hypothetical protein
MEARLYANINVKVYSGVTLLTIASLIIALVCW